MAYNTRRGNISFNRNISSSGVGNRRPIVTNNYVQPPQNSGSSPSQNPGYTTQQHATKQLRQQQPNAQQQLAKQQQMLVQKKQQLALQQKQQKQQQKQQVVQQENEIVMKLEEENQELEQQKQELEEQKQELEQQKEKDIEQQKLKEVELQKQCDLELEKQRELAIKVEKEIAEQVQKELKQHNQTELEQEKQREANIKKENEQEKQKELEQKKQQLIEEEKVTQPQGAQQPKLDQAVGIESVVQNDQTMDQLEPQQMVQGDQVYSLPDATKANGPGSNPGKKRSTLRRKLSRYEIRRRRNMKLSKILQPKNALAVLHEVVDNVTFNIVKQTDGRTFSATVVVDDVQHKGFAMNKVAAKNSAAEKALKYLVQHKKLIQAPPSDVKEGNQEPMDTSETEGDVPLAWQHFASFAIYKLLDSWGNDLNIIKETPRVMKKPAKKLPDKASKMNPLMLLNQMMPQTHLEELPKTLNGQTYTFRFKCDINGQTFIGSGTSKKVAKKQTAFEVCRKVLGIEYPPEIYSPQA